MYKYIYIYMCTSNHYDGSKVLNASKNVELLYLTAIKLRCRRAESSHSLYLGPLGWMLVRPPKNERRSDRQPQNMGKVENLAPAPLGASGEFSISVLPPWIRIKKLYSPSCRRCGPVTPLAYRKSISRLPWVNLPPLGFLS